MNSGAFFLDGIQTPMRNEASTGRVYKPNLIDVITSQVDTKTIAYRFSCPTMLRAPNSVSPENFSIIQLSGLIPCWITKIAEILKSMTYIDAERLPAPWSESKANDKLYREDSPPDVGSIDPNFEISPLLTARCGIWSAEFHLFS